MFYGNIKNYDVANGEGVRISLFVSGCRHHCKNCFQPQTWNFCYGKEFTSDTEQQILDMLKPNYIKGITLLGGEPFEPENQPALVSLLNKIKSTYRDKDVWCYSGYTYEQLLGKEKFVPSSENESQSANSETIDTNKTQYQSQNTQNKICENKSQLQGKINETVSQNCKFQQKNNKNTVVFAKNHPRTDKTDEMLSLIDVLVDGEFVDSKKDISLNFRGSSNQRIIDLNQTRMQGKVVLHKLNN